MNKNKCSAITIDLSARSSAQMGITMRRIALKWGSLFCLVFLPLAGAVLFFSQSERERMLEERKICRSLYAEIQVSDNIQQVHPWCGDDGVYYLVLPSYADTAAVSLRCEERYGREILLNGRRPEYSMEEICQDFQGEKAVLRMDIRNRYGRRLEEATLVVYTTRGLPAVYIETSTGNMDTIHASKNNREKGKIAVYTQEGKVDYEGNLDYIKGRGNVTWEERKKPYNFSLGQPEGILGMNASKEWTLLAGAKDTSYIRNKLAFGMAEQMGLSDTTDSNFVNLYLNGEYTGLYLMTEKVGVEGGDDKKQEHLLELEMQERLEGEPNAFQTKAGQGIVIKSPVTEQQKTEIAGQVQKFEDAVYDNDWEKTEELVDMDSFVKIYLIEEVLQNHDAYISSQYMKIFETNGELGKMYSGPVWDFDSCLTPKDGMYAKTLTAGQPRANYPKYWMPFFLKNAEFLELVKEEYKIVEESYLQEKIWQDIAGYQKTIENAVELDCLRWGYQTKENWEKQLDTMQEYLKERVAFLNDLWINGELFYTIHLEVNSDTFGNMDYLVKAGEECKDFPEYFTRQGYTFSGWYRKGTNTAFHPEEKVEGDVFVEARWEKKAGASIVGNLKAAGILQARYMLFILLLLATVALLAAERKQSPWRK